MSELTNKWTKRRHRNSVAIDPLRNSATATNSAGHMWAGSASSESPHPSPGFVGTVHMEVMPRGWTGSPNTQATKAALIPITQAFLNRARLWRDGQTDEARDLLAP